MCGDGWGVPYYSMGGWGAAVLHAYSSRRTIVPTIESEGGPGAVGGIVWQWEGI